MCSSLGTRPFFKVSAAETIKKELKQIRVLTLTIYQGNLTGNLRQMHSKKPKHAASVIYLPEIARRLI